MSVNVNSITDSYNAWYDYKYGGNTRGITEKDMAQIEERWKCNLSKWEAQAAKDENKYEISDDDFSTAKAAEKQDAKDKTGCSGKKGGMIVRGAADATLGIAGAVGSTVGKGFLNKVGTHLAGKVSEKAFTQMGGEKLAEAGGMKFAGNAKTGSFIITAPLALGVGSLYQAKKPNKDEHEAAKELYETMLPDANGELGEAQAIMQDATENVVELTEEANEMNEAAADLIEENKVKFDKDRAAFLELQERAKNGEKLTDSEKQLYQELYPSMQQKGEEINTIKDDVSDEVVDIRDDIGAYQSEFDDAADTIAQVQGLTDYAEGFDETAQVMTYVEAVSQGMNAASGTKAAIDAGRFAASGGIFTAWAWGFSAMGAAGAVMSGLGAYEQYQWAGDIGQEIDARRMTQDFGSQTLDAYDEQIEMYDDNIDIVEDLELAIPDDMEVPEPAPLEENGDNKTNLPLLAQNDSTKADDKKDKDKKDKPNQA